MRAQYATVGPLAAANAAILRAAATIAAIGPLTLLVTALDNQRRILITVVGAATAVLTLTGNDKNGNPVTETITLAGAGTYQSVLDYFNNIAISSSATTAGTVAIGTNGVASSGWMQINASTVGSALLALVVSGTVNYTVQVSLDNPNDLNPNNPAPTAAQVIWFNTNDTTAVAATGSVLTNLWFMPIWVKVLLNSSTSPGFVRATLLQGGITGS